MLNSSIFRFILCYIDYHTNDRKVMYSIKIFKIFFIFVDTNSKRMYIKPGFCVVSPFLASL